MANYGRHGVDAVLPPGPAARKHAKPTCSIIPAAVLERVMELLRATSTPARFGVVTVTEAPLDADEHLHRLYERDMDKVGRGEGEWGWRTGIFYYSY